MGSSVLRYSTKKELSKVGSVDGLCYKGVPIEDFDLTELRQILSLVEGHLEELRRLNYEMYRSVNKVDLCLLGIS
ncbi:MAG: hypothetical protein ACYSUK_00040 [Planctomycetota bacterium]|jgi:hypothetical protein